ncbi:MAG: acyl-CoA dehydrogenase family protein [Gemmatimonadetes bacterium]|nr:acyl-CoA dehydrogenase family protein [Gemmatimonadota bacterium]
MAFKGVDYVGLDEDLSVEERMARDTVRRFVDEQVLPVIEEAYLEGRFPTELVPGLAELGVLGANLPEEYGCAGMNNVAYGLVMQELERGDSGVRSFASVQGALVMYPIFEFGSEAQKRKWLPAMAAGEAIGCFGLTEADYGSNPGGMATRAEKRGDGWVLNGSKMWITNGSMADVAVVWAKTDEGVRGFLVEAGTPGYTTNRMHGKHSLRASDTSELIFVDVELPGDAILPGSSGLKSPLMCLNQARYGIVWGAVGSAMACYEEALRYSGERIQFDKPIASFQLVQQRLVEMLEGVTLGQLLAHRLGRLKDRGKLGHAQVSLAKRHNVMMARQVASAARWTLGANGIHSEYQVMRHMGNIESVFTYEGTHDIHTLVVGQDITGISAVT